MEEGSFDPVVLGGGPAGYSGILGPWKNGLADLDVKGGTIAFLKSG